eukprot:TRINITY_DN1152_c0_g1_i11.p1 TRINITY_DN1152_c0_g1~~TRINITY_DN1152_c0_g1_i11.p1  ORF type:complete len:127 (+),score=6.84 TRINITY_DN1152_c0_g1_i11:628-1008(+)
MWRTRMSECLQPRRVLESYTVQTAGDHGPLSSSEMVLYKRGKASAARDGSANPAQSMIDVILAEAMQADYGTNDDEDAKLRRASQRTKIPKRKGDISSRHPKISPNIKSTNVLQNKQPLEENLRSF